MGKDMIIEKSVVIGKPRREVFDFIKKVRNQDHYSVWNMKDPNKKIETSGTDGTPGFVYTWDSKDNSVGAGTQEIVRIVDNDRVECRIRFERPMKNVADTKMTVSDAANGSTRVTWEFRGPTSFPMSLFSFIFKRMLGKDMQKGLDNLRSRLEQ